MPEIKNCPCCDGPGVLKDTRGKIRQGWVGCPECQLYIQWKISPAGAIKKWNQRAGWTSVKYKTPTAGLYLVACDEWGGSRVRKAAYDDFAGWIEIGGTAKPITEFVTYFMPLPEPPKEDET